MKKQKNLKYRRNCPECNKEVLYGYKESFWIAKKENRWCSSCRAIEISHRPETKTRLKIQGEKQKVTMKGRGNPFYGKRHSQETKDTIRKNTPVVCGKNHPMYGKTNYDIWVKKYGKKEAYRLEKRRRKRLSNSTKGKKSHMYGISPPEGAGNGWSGWYKNWYFRSLLELSYMINVIERNKLNWENAEQNKYTVEYEDWDMSPRTYRADFIINNKIMVECKPLRLQKSLTVKLKAEAARKFCASHKLKYELACPIKLSNNKLVSLFKSGKIKFIKRYEKKFKEKYL